MYVSENTARAVIHDHFMLHNEVAHSVDCLAVLYENLAEGEAYNTDEVYVWQDEVGRFVVLTK